MNKNKHILKDRDHKAQRIRSLTIAIVSAGTMMMGSISSAVAFDGVVRETVRTINCIGLLISNPEQHLIECGTGDATSSGTLVPGTYVPTPETPPSDDSDDSDDSNPS